MMIMNMTNDDNDDDTQVINQYQDKLNEATSSYQQKIGILENKIIEKEMERTFQVPPIPCYPATGCWMRLGWSYRGESKIV